MKKIVNSFLIIVVITMTTSVVIAQTPYDNFAPGNKKKEILKLQEATFRAFNVDTTNSIKYIELDKETGAISYYGKNDVLLYTMILNPIESKWLSVDPKASKYSNVSPYNFVNNNPIRNIDPDGRDVWEINAQGAIVNRIKDKTQDAFYIVAKDAGGKYQRTYTTDADGNKNYNSISFKYGTIKSQQTLTFSSDNKKGGTYDVFQVKGDGNGKNLFQFMAKNTTVEWSQAQTGVEGDKGSNFLTTSHLTDKDPGIKHLYEHQLYNGYTIREINHSHPGNTPFPSGLGLPGGKPRGSADIGFSRMVTNNSQLNGLNVPIFNIYLPNSNSYISYDPNSIPSDYGL